MPLNINQLSQDIENALNKRDKKALNNEGNLSLEQLNKKLALDIAKAIQTYIMNADVVVNTQTPAVMIQPGIATVGSPAAQSTVSPGVQMPGSGTGTGQGKIQ